MLKAILAKVSWSVLGPCHIVGNTGISLFWSLSYGVFPSSREAGKERRGRNSEGEVRCRGENAQLLMGVKGETAVTDSQRADSLLVCPCHSLVY